MTLEPPARDVVSIQMLRGIAATMVVFVHIDNQLRRLNYGTFGWGWLAAGVDIFFVISGFIMWTAVERRQGITASEFLRNRVIRIVPLYWFVGALVLILAILAPHAFRTTVLRPWHAIASFLFLPARHPVTGDFWPLVIPGWSLNFEMLFYLVFALAIAWSGGHWLKRYLLVAGILGTIVIVARLTSSEFDVMNFYSNPMLLEFLSGMVLGIVWRSARVPTSNYWALLVVIGFLLLWSGSRLNGGFVLVALSATLIVAGAVFTPAVAHNPLSSLGDASYSLYLTHTATLAAFGALWHALFWYLDWEAFVLAAVASAILVSLMTYRIFEVPVTAALKQASRRRKIAPAPEAFVTLSTSGSLEPAIIAPQAVIQVDVGSVSGGDCN